MGHEPSTPRYALRDLPLAARLVLTVFLLSVGLGYAAALVQLKFQHAPPGELMPGRDETIRIFHDKTHNLPPSTKDSDDPTQPERRVGRIEELLVANPDQKLRPSTQMRTAFTKDSEDWEDEIAKRCAETKAPVKDVKKRLAAEREGERLAVLAWLHAYGPKAPYDNDSFPLPADWSKDQPITEKYKLDGGKAVKLKSIFTDRCVTCHHRGGEGDNLPFEEFASIQKFIPDPPKPTKVVKNIAPGPPKTQPGMSIEKLAQTTHVHLLGFSMLYGLTGLIFAFSSYPLVVRCFLCPLPLLAQVADIACWWLAREAKPYGPMFASVIPITGGIVALGLLTHIMLSLFNMYGTIGKLVLVLLFAGAGAGGYYYVKPIVMDVIQHEKDEAAAAKAPAPEPDK